MVTDAENFGLFLESLADNWIGELLVEIVVPCGFHLRLFSFAGVRGAVFCPVLAACLDPEVPFRICRRGVGNCVAVPRAFHVGFGFFHASHHGVEELLAHRSLRLVD
jgi:hypothetical protein